MTPGAPMEDLIEDHHTLMIVAEDPLQRGGGDHHQMIVTAVDLQKGGEDHLMTDEAHPLKGVAVLPLVLTGMTDVGPLLTAEALMTAEDPMTAEDLMTVTAVDPRLIAGILLMTVVALRMTVVALLMTAMALPMTAVALHLVITGLGGLRSSGRDHLMMIWARCAWTTTENLNLNCRTTV